MTRRISSITMALVFLVSFSYVVYEPVLIRAASVDDEITVQLTVTSSISITSPSNVTMSPNITATQDSSTGEATWNVKTNNTSGYDLALSASTNPAMQSGSDSFADYTETSADDPENWTIGASAYEFGYSVEGDDTSAEMWGNDCVAASAGTIKKTEAEWIGFTTTDFDVASTTSATTKSGTDTTVCFAAEQGASVYAPSGVYTATITATATER